MKFGYRILLLIIVTLSFSCSSEESSEDDKLMKEYKKTDFEKIIRESKYEKNPPLAERDKAPAELRKKYPFPSIMIEDDMLFTYIKVSNGLWEDKAGITTSLIINDNWKTISDKYGRLCQYHSKEITYSELQNTLHFLDPDVTVNKDKKEGEPDAYIKTPWLVCNIYYTDKPYNGIDKSVKLKAKVINVEVQANSDKHLKYDKNKSTLQKVLDTFIRVH